MKILVIGGNRFFGKKLTALWLAQKADVTLLNRGNLDDGFGDKVRRIKMNRQDLNRNFRNSEEWDLVYDQACYTASEALGACEFFNGKVKKYVFTSSQSVYGPGADLKESDFNPQAHIFDKQADKDSDYAEAKRQAEAVFFNKADFLLTAVRFPIVLGPDDYTLRLKFHVDHVKEGKEFYLPNIESKISFIHSTDAAQTLFHLGTSSLNGPVNACAKSPVMLRNLVNQIEELTGQKAVYALKPSDKNRSPFGISNDWYMDISKLKGSGFEPRPISDWLKDSITCYL